MTKTVKKHELANSFTVSDKDLSKLFSRCGKELEKILLDIRPVKRSQTRNINLQEKTVSELFFRFLSELISLKDTYQLVFSEINVDVTEESASLSGSLKGERFDKTRHTERLRNKLLNQKNCQLLKIGTIWKAEVSLTS